MAATSIPKPCEPVQIASFLQDAKNEAGVYFLYRGGLLVYVGQSLGIVQRIMGHLDEGVKSFDAVAFLHCKPSQRLSVERYYIQRHAPEYNQCLTANSTRDRKPWNVGKAGEWFDEYQAAALLGVKPEHVKAWLSDGLLPPPVKGKRRYGRPTAQCGRWPREVLIQFVANHPQELDCARAQF